MLTHNNELDVKRSPQFEEKLNFVLDCMIEEIDRVVKLMNFVLDKCSNKQLTYSLGSL